MTSLIEQKIEELKKLLDNPRTGLKDSSDTNKTRYAILALFESERESMKQKAIDRVPKKHGNLYDDLESKAFNECREQTLQALSEI